MILGVGCDIVDIRRISNALEKNSEKFCNRIFTKNEIEKSNAHDTASFFAKRFAAKEAYAKAARCGIGGNLSFQSLEISNDENNAPYFSKHLKTDVKAFLSLSDEYPYAIAYVVLSHS